MLDAGDDICSITILTGRNQNKFLAKNNTMQKGTDVMFQEDRKQYLLRFCH